MLLYKQSSRRFVFVQIFFLAGYLFQLSLSIRCSFSALFVYQRLWTIEFKQKEGIPFVSGAESKKERTFGTYKVPSEHMVLNIP